MQLRFLSVGACLLACWTAAAAQQDAPATQPNPEGPAATANSHEPARARPDLTPDASGRLSTEQMRELTRVVAQNYRDNFKRERSYTYVERDVEKTLGGNGQVKSTEVRTYDIVEIYGEQVRRLIEKDDKPLGEKEAAKEEERIQNIIDKRKNETDDERKDRLEKEAKQHEKSRKFVTDIADSHEFRLVGTEVLDGREAWVIDGDPRPGYDPQDKESKFVSKFRGRLWIDKDDLQLAKMDIEAVDTASVGWIMARIHKGTRVTYDQLRMNDEIWLPQHLTYKFEARVALLKGYNIDGEVTYREYKKFRTSSKIVGIGEVQEQK